MSEYTGPASKYGFFVQEVHSAAILFDFNCQSPELSSRTSSVNQRQPAAHKIHEFYFKIPCIWLDFHRCLPYNTINHNMNSCCGKTGNYGYAVRVGKLIGAFLQNRGG